jgi:GNAT superfamily N-acetyltransferase
MIDSQLPLRRAVSADAAAVTALTRAAYAKWVPVIGREPRPMTADYDRAVVHHAIDVLESDGKLIALIEWKAEPTHILIVNIAVHPDRQATGLGSLLLQHAEAMAQAHNVAELRLYTNAAFASNLALYARRGFEETGREAFPGGGGIVYMRKAVA